MRRQVYLCVLVVLILVSGCVDRNQETGTNYFVYSNETANKVTLTFLNERGSLDTITEIGSFETYTREFYWEEGDGLRYPTFLSNTDTVKVFFDQERVLNYDNQSQMVFNGKNIFNFSLYSIDTLSESKNHLEIRYTFPFTNQDYAIADSL